MLHIKNSINEDVHKNRPDYSYFEVEPTLDSREIHIFRFLQTRVTYLLTKFFIIIMYTLS